MVKMSQKYYLFLTMIILNNIRDRRGLWLINEYCENIFQTSETIFREKKGGDKQDRLLSHCRKFFEKFWRQFQFWISL